jgi:2-dehydropantoate 2-reductase
MLRRKGLSIASPKGDVALTNVHAVDRAKSVGPVDIVLFTVKLYDAELAAATLAPLLGTDTVVVTLQNGVEIVDLVARHVGRKHVAGGAAYIMVALDGPGPVVHTAVDALVFGELDGTRSARLETFEEAGRRAGFDARLTTSIDLELWTKFVRLATWSGMTAVTRMPLDVIRDDPTLSSMMASALDEGIAVARARGIALPEDLAEKTRSFVATFPAGSKSSMLDDLEHGRRLELDWLSGAIARMGRETGVATPVHAFIAAVLGPLAHGARRRT